MSLRPERASAGEGHGPVKEAVEAVETARRRQVFGREADVPLADHRRGVA
jgi:hypothetical protein